MTDTFLGFARADGTVGVRNHVLVLSVTGLTGPTARRVGRILPRAVVVAHPYGNGVIGPDAVVQRRVLQGLAAHPSVAGASAWATPRKGGLSGGTSPPSAATSTGRSVARPMNSAASLVAGRR